MSIFWKRAVVKTDGSHSDFIAWHVYVCHMHGLMGPPPIFFLPFCFKASANSTWFINRFYVHVALHRDAMEVVEYILPDREIYASLCVLLLSFIPPCFGKMKSPGWVTPRKFARPAILSWLDTVVTYWELRSWFMTGSEPLLLSFCENKVGWMCCDRNWLPGNILCCFLRGSWETYFWNDLKATNRRLKKLQFLLELLATYFFVMK